MPEGQMSPETTMMGTAPEHVGAVFKQGRNARAWFIKEAEIPTCDVTIKEERETMVLQNMGAFAFNVADPEAKWKTVVDFYVADLRVAATETRKDPDPKKRIERADSLETEKDMKAMMAVMASARAMEKSAGNFERYSTYITLSIPPDMDKADTWSDYLIHGDREKLERVIKNPYVSVYYNKLMAEVQKGRESELVKYLTSKTPKDAPKDWCYRGLEEYISDYLLDEPQDLTEVKDDSLVRFGAARLAADAFLVDKYAQWEYDIDPANDLKLKPTPGWGGNPLREFIEPSFLPRRVKGMYKDSPEILDSIDAAFRLNDIAKDNKTFREERLLPTMTMKLKSLGRYHRALDAFLGGPRANGIPLWTKDTLSKDLPTIFDQMDQVYGGIEEREDESKPIIPVGRHVMGVLMTRVIAAKAAAAVSESAKPNLADRLAYLTEAKGGESFEEARAFLLGPKFDATEGFLYQLASSKTRVIFARNMFPGVEEMLTNALDMLEYNVSGANEIKKGKLFRRAKGLLIILQGLGAQKVRR